MNAPPALDHRHLFEAWPGAVLVVLPDAPHFTILTASDAYLKATLTTRETLIGQGLFEAFPDAPDLENPSGTGNLRASLERALASGEPDQMADQLYPIRTPAGQWEERWWRPINTPLRSGDGVIAYLVHSVEDVTSSKRLAREERQAKEEAIDAAELLQEQAVELELQIENAQGLNIELEETREHLQHANQALELESRRLREVFERAPAFLAVLRGPDHVFQFVNEAYYQLVGHRDLIGRAAFEALPEVRGQGFEELLDTVLATGEPYVGREARVMITRTPGAEPEERFIDLVYYPMRETDGTLSGVVAHGYDVTDHIQARQEAQHARTEAEEANQAKDQFVAQMSHEIRTPINAIVGYTELLELGVAGSLTAAQQEYLARIRGSSQHLMGLVNDILDLAKIEAGELGLHLDATSIAEPIARALSLIEPQAVAKGVELTDVSECAPDTEFYGDEDRVRQIVINLLSNAVKFTPRRGRVTVRCALRVGSGPSVELSGMGPWLVVEVQDNGIGIQPELLASVFEPFIQVEGGHTRKEGGTGLGLTISRRLARLMGGDLWLESTPGEGSTFALWLPAAARNAEGDPMSQCEPAEPVDGWRGSLVDTRGLGATGRLIVAQTEHIDEELQRRLRDDSHIQGVATLDAAQLGDHLAAFITALGKMLVGVDEGRGEASYMDDSQAILDLVATRHGRQRHRLGWNRAEVAREYEIFHEVLETIVRTRSSDESDVDVDTSLTFLHRLLDRALGESLAAYDRAHNGVEPGERALERVRTVATRSREAAKHARIAPDEEG